MSALVDVWRGSTQGNSVYEHNVHFKDQSDLLHDPGATKDLLLFKSCTCLMKTEVFEKKAKDNQVMLTANVWNLTSIHRCKE